MKKEDLRIAVLENITELGEKVNKHLQELNNSKTKYIVDIENVRFSNGEGKVKINSSVRDTDLFILADVGNYNMSYNFFGREHFMSPDEHFQDIKRSISATSGSAKRIVVVMPLLYQARQHKRKGRESLDCAIALQELETLGVNSIITFDAHDPNISNAIPNLPFENFYPTHIILNDLIDNEDIDMNNLLVVRPDMGAVERARYYAEMLSCDVGIFYKRRDLTKVVNGKNPIVAHMYMGADVVGKDIIVVDDMIASGQSMIEVASELKKKGANKVFLIATFSLLTEGIEKFEEAYQNGEFNRLYSTNLSYVPKEIKEKEWYHDVDCSYYLANIINTLNKEDSLSKLFNGKEVILEKVKILKKKINRMTKEKNKK